MAEKIEIGTRKCIMHKCKGCGKNMAIGYTFFGIVDEKEQWSTRDLRLKKDAYGNDIVRCFDCKGD